jgi:hypothetical protein
MLGSLAITVASGAKNPVINRLKRTVSKQTRPKHVVIVDNRLLSEGSDPG